MDLTLSSAIADYIEQRKQIKLEPFQKALNKVLDKSDDPIAIGQAKAEYAEASAPIEEAFTPVTWLTDAAKRAKQISLATHAAKFTHSDAKASSMLVTSKEPDPKRYLTTSSLKDKAIDAVGNAAALDVAKLLKISVENESLVDQLQNQSLDALKAFTDDAELLAEWQAGFEKALGDEKLSGHTLSKQLYYPVALDNNEPKYHLLCPLFSSSMAHELHSQVTKTRFGEAKDIRDARKKGLYHSKLAQSFPSTAVQNFGGSKPQNISQLNSERYGQSYLLNCAPPNYQAQSKPPIKSKSIFNREFSFKTSAIIREFKTFLIGLSEQDKNFATRYKRDYEFVQPLLDTLFDYAAQIQSLTAYAGWASDEECQMKSQHALWLDANNPSPKFQAEREKGNWLEDIAGDFAHWLLIKLTSKEDYLLGDVEHNYFKKLCLYELKAFERHTPTLGVK